MTLKRYLILVGALLGLSSIAVGFEIGATAMRILVTLLMLITVNADARSRRVIIYPLVSDRREFTFTACGPSVYAGYEIVATVVVADQMDRLYGIHCRVTKRWDHCHLLPDNAYWVDLKDHSMNIWAQWEGNQHKGYADKFVIDDIVQSTSPFKDVADTDAFKRSEAFKQLVTHKTQ